MKNALCLLFGGIVLAIIAFGFYLTGSPSENRLFREDELRVQDLRHISSAVGRYFRDEKKAPTTLQSVFEECENQTAYFCQRLQGAKPGDFEYAITDEKSYQLCTTFERAAPFAKNKPRNSNNAAHHEAGRQCYSYKFPKIGN